MLICYLESTSFSVEKLPVSLCSALFIFLLGGLQFVRLLFSTQNALLNMCIESCLSKLSIKFICIMAITKPVVEYIFYHSFSNFSFVYEKKPL